MHDLALVVESPAMEAGSIGHGRRPANHPHCRCIILERARKSFVHSLRIFFLNRRVLKFFGNMTTRIAFWTEFLSHS
jgi:hypothetical protein